MLADGLAASAMPRYRVGPLNPRSRMADEWVVLTIGPHQAAAFLARDCGDDGPDELRNFDYYYTHDRNLIVRAARSFLQEL